MIQMWSFSSSSMYMLVISAESFHGMSGFEVVKIGLCEALHMLYWKLQLLKPSALTKGMIDDC